jgi:hypothetical protein
VIFGSDVMLGEDGSDKMYGNRGHDIMGGGADRDVIRGNRGNDRLYGGTGNDKLRGGWGNDKKSKDGNVPSEHAFNCCGCWRNFAPEEKCLVEDYGDAPATYETLLIDNGARHIPGRPEFGMGGGIEMDKEEDGVPRADALGDDNADADDEDGIDENAILIPGTFGIGQTGTISIDVNGPVPKVAPESFEGISYRRTGITHGLHTPPDPTAGADELRLVAAVNSRIAIFDKLGGHQSILRNLARPLRFGSRTFRVSFSAQRSIATLAIHG